MTFVAACAQIAPRKAETAANLDRIAEVTLEASAAGADLVLFPETATSGYFLEGGVYESAISSATLAQELESRMQGLPKPIDIALGFYELEGASLYNAAAYLEIGAEARIRQVYRKFFLPTYGVFDEERFVSRGRELGVFETRFGRMALLICEDVWHSILPTLAAVAGASVLLVPSASPARGFGSSHPDNLDRYERLLKCVAEEHGVFCVNCQLCGFEGGKGFTGGSMMIDPMGQTMVQAPIVEEHIIYCTIDLDLVPLARAQTPLLSDLESAWGDIARIAQSNRLAASG
ncbi:MAG TPA: nitrilase-related carbon-nitrogen hydrolase [Fimbriimonadaceae bacterium]|nr:nitrilase-related carbon-nitrogen hydrolase [Fimbriimonadaceae bacterium]HRJ95298.1 nitrilase-related carbon-nitrogen hydrolase [Fimbriimonadaceae bacterium]